MTISIHDGLRLGEKWSKARKRIWERDWHMRYPCSRPLGRGSVHPASNPVYDHSYVYKGAIVGGQSYVDHPILQTTMD
jgi:hypothetical protein